MELLIREEPGGCHAHKVAVIINEVRFESLVTDPFANSDKTGHEILLEWYFEEWLKYPMLKTAKAEKARHTIYEYGCELFKQLFSDRETYLAYSRFRDKASTNPKAVVKLSGSAAFHALHWEFMRDPDREFPIALDLPFVRTEFKGGALRSEFDGSGAAVRVLLVTARPSGRQDVGYHTISRPLLDALANTPVRAQVELLRPGTYEALVKRLEARRYQQYHILHFDLGYVMTFVRYHENQ